MVEVETPLIDLSGATMNEALSMFRLGEPRDAIRAYIHERARREGLNPQEAERIVFRVTDILDRRGIRGPRRHW